MGAFSRPRASGGDLRDHLQGTFFYPLPGSAPFRLYPFGKVAFGIGFWFRFGLEVGSERGGKQRPLSTTWTSAPAPLSPEEEWRSYSEGPLSLNMPQ
ncbi:hypothetical protein J1605_012474, partial [Eschrichtius robustus]